jgi:hypothetical protein
MVLLLVILYFFERMFDWRGVLIEAQPQNARKLLRVNRPKTVKLPIGICSFPQTTIEMLVIFYAYKRLKSFFNV